MLKFANANEVDSESRTKFVEYNFDRVEDGEEVDELVVTGKLYLDVNDDLCGRIELECDEVLSLEEKKEVEAAILKEVGTYWSCTPGFAWNDISNKERSIDFSEQELKAIDIALRHYILDHECGRFGPKSTPDLRDSLDIVKAIKTKLNNA